MQRRETERQQESRLNSYAFLAAREQQEPWRVLHAIPPRPDIVDAMLYSAVEESVPMDLSQQDYSCAILPGAATPCGWNRIERPLRRDKGPSHTVRRRA